MIRRYGLLFFLVLFSLGIAAQTNDICKDIKFLASDKLEGRKLGSEGYVKASTYILDQFKSDKLKLLFEDGFQYFDVVTHMEAGKDNSLSCGTNSLMVGNDFIPYSYCYDTNLTAPCLFAGYGISADSLGWDDYKEVDVSGKWVMILRGNPQFGKGSGKFMEFNPDISKMMEAKKHGAAGIITVTGNDMNTGDDLVPLGYESIKRTDGIVAVNITRSAADKLLASSGKTIKQLEDSMISVMRPLHIAINEPVKADIDLKLIKEKDHNIAAMCMSNKSTDEYIVVGAHYDHLGIDKVRQGAPGYGTTAIHNGADDNASGTAMMLEMARVFTKSALNGKYNIIFVAFASEERGLLGSSWFVHHLPIDRKKIKLMINFDMVGRLNTEKKLFVGGTGTFPDAVKILRSDVDTNELKLVLSQEGNGPSDHSSFYSNSIPVLYFNTGLHEDYHTPTDDYEKINCDGLHTISEFIIRLIKDICQNTYDLSYHESNSAMGPVKRGDMKVKLGVMPDFGRQDVKGFAVGGVNEGGPAQKSGMKKGDVIVSINGKTVNNIYEYMEIMKTMSAGQHITVDVMRGTEKVELSIQL